MGEGIKFRIRYSGSTSTAEFPQRCYGLAAVNAGVHRISSHVHHEQLHEDVLKSTLTKCRATNHHEQPLAAAHRTRHAHPTVLIHRKLWIHIFTPRPHSTNDIPNPPAALILGIDILERIPQRECRYEAVVSATTEKVNIRRRRGGAL